MNKIEIPLSKTKLIFILIGSLMFVVGGLYLISTNADQQSVSNPIWGMVLGIAAVIFFGCTGIYSIKKMFDKAMGLIIDSNGIFDNTHTSSVGLIKWEDIIEIKTQQVGATRFLLIYTSNPDYYLDKAKGFKRKLMEINYRTYETPLSITSNTLKCNFSDLEKQINDRLVEQRERKATT